MTRPWTPKPGDRIVRRPREEALAPVRLSAAVPRPRSRALATPLILLKGGRHGWRAGHKAVMDSG